MKTKWVCSLCKDEAPSGLENVGDTLVPHSCGGNYVHTPASPAPPVAPSDVGAPFKVGDRVLVACQYRGNSPRTDCICVMAPNGVLLDVRSGDLHPEAPTAVPAGDWVSGKELRANYVRREEWERTKKECDALSIKLSEKENDEATLSDYRGDRDAWKERALAAESCAAFFERELSRYPAGKKLVEARKKASK